MLLPLRLRELSPQQGNLVVMVDQKTAPYPWELLEDRWSNGGRPPAVAAGFVRQFRTTEFRQRPVHGQSNTALVIGNPDLSGATDFSDLPGAREEARQVAEQLSNAGYEVLDCIDQTSTPIMESLHKNSWRMVHLAGHGVHRYLNKGADANTKPISGMVIGNNTFLTPGDIKQLRFVPELVFVNCCHLGRVDGPRELDRLGLAANLGEELIQMGVRAVIAAGWAVDDRAGQVFAASFYKHMLAGIAFGEAVRLAREEVWSRCPDVNTWGAYQCYGDPAFRLHRDGNTAPIQWPDFGTPHELVTDLNNLIAGLRAGAHSEHGADKIARRLARIPKSQSEAWRQRADVCAALGQAWGELGQWEQAVTWLVKALNSERGECPMRAIEQLANFRVRLAAERWYKAQRTPLPKRETTRQSALAEVEAAILDLDTLCSRAPTAERLNLLGSAYKRLAGIESDQGKRLDALTNMAHHYQLSLTRQAGAYAFTNWLAATLLIGQLGGPKVIEAAALQQQMAEMQRSLAQRLEDDPNFWDAASMADLGLSELLLQSLRQPKRRAKVSAGETAAPVLVAYRTAIGRASSPRETASLIENLVFLKTLWAPTDKLTLHILDHLHESLT
jgi:tetratricopeptide (TPR) repeat protein